MDIFSDLENLLTCNICKKVIENPVISPGCQHCFCAFCIRSSLALKKSCPLCGIQSFESELVKVPLLEEISRWFTANQAKFEIKNSNPSSKPESERCGASAGAGGPSNDSTEGVFDSVESVPAKIYTGDKNHQQKRKLSEERPSTISDWFKKSKKTNSDVESIEVVDIDQDDVISVSNEDFYENESNSSFNFVDSQDSHGEHKDKYKSDISIQSIEPAQPKSMPNTRPHLTKFIKSKYSPLPKLSYNLITNTKLKEKLKALGLPIDGSREDLEERYNHYQILWNSNIDSSYPLSKEKLLSKLKEWDQIRKLNAHNKKLFNDLNSSSLSANEEWLKKYSEQFNELIKKAKSNGERSTGHEPTEQKSESRI